jgi:3-phenylpropionate/cinnamic acid dioxygenase small subunit
VTPDNPTADPWSTASPVLDETKDSLERLWAVRYMPEHVEYAWGENPPQRVRRFVTGLRVSVGESPGEYLTESNLLLSFVRQSDPVTLVPAGRVDVVREEDGVMKLASRIVHLDQTRMTITHMRLVF